MTRSELKTITIILDSLAQLPVTVQRGIFRDTCDKRRRQPQAVVTDAEKMNRSIKRYLEQEREAEIKEALAESECY